MRGDLFGLTKTDNQPKRGKLYNKYFKRHAANGCDLQLS